MQNSGLILTSYETLRNVHINICAVDFEIVVLDEVQKIKTPGTLLTNAAKSLKAHFKIAMTGTPVENTLVDLWCIMDFCCAGLLGNAKQFASKYKSNNTEEDIIKNGNEIRKRLGIFFMRRLKKDVIQDLPKKKIVPKKEYMPPVQQYYYKMAVENYQNSDNKLKAIQSLKVVSEHPYLIDNSLDKFKSNVLIERSAKLKLTIKFIDSILKKGEKVIVFAELKQTQHMLQRIFYDKYGITAKIINGDTPSTEQKSKQSRQSAINEFSKSLGFGIIIMSPLAAGMGLNVTAANHVIHYSRHWNPAKENQATDRAYRIGQKKDVYVYYPMAILQKGKAFDEVLDSLLNKKTELAESTLFPTVQVEVKSDMMAQMLFG